MAKNKGSALSLAHTMGQVADEYHRLRKIKQDKDELEAAKLEIPLILEKIKKESECGYYTTNWNLSGKLISAEAVEEILKTDHGFFVSRDCKHLHISWEIDAIRKEI